jgi:hypothetical protein
VGERRELDRAAVERQVTAHFMREKGIRLWPQRSD